MADDDLATAARVFQVIRPKGGPTKLDELAFSSHLQFYLTIGYLTPEQAAALDTWFRSNGMVRLETIPGPPGISGPSMYEILSTRITVGTPGEVRDLLPPAAAGMPAVPPAPVPGKPGDPVLQGGVLEFFSGLADAVGDLLTSATEGIVDVLSAGTALIQAGTALVHEIHEAVVLAP